VVREATVFTGILRWILATLLLALGSSHLLAQQRNLGGAPTTVQTRQPAPRQSNLQRLAAGTVFRDCAYCPELVVIPPGNFTMGSPENEAGRMSREEPQQSVAIPSAIGVGKYEVTKAQFARFVRESGHVASGGCFVWNGSKYEQDASKDWRNPGFAQTDKDPVVCVNWNDANAYTAWLTKKTGKRYRLPTEAEWEYAARAGTQTSRPWGDNASDACRYANVADATAKRDVPGTASWTFHECNDNHAYTAPVGSYQPNAFGLYDMLGNAWEWTEDCWREEYTGAPSDDGDASSGDCGRRVLRGGGWVDSPAFVRYDFRFFIGSDDRDFYLGFRVARTD
jgi:formylglycine-generating enzyme required for sulfatase activity